MEMARFRLNDCNVKEGVQRIDYVRATYVWMQTEGTRTDPKDTRMLLVIAWRREATCMQVLILGMGRVESNMDLFFLTCPDGPRLHGVRPSYGKLTCRMRTGEHGVSNWIKNWHLMRQGVTGKRKKAGVLSCWESVIWSP